MTSDEANSRIRFLRSLAGTLAFLACVLLLMFALDRLARHQLRQSVDAAAIASLGALVHAQTPHRWDARRPADIVAGRAFGTDDAAFGDDGFRFRAQAKVDVGLVLPRDLDLVRFTSLDVYLRSDRPGKLEVVVRESLEGPACVSGATPFSGESETISIRLEQLSWTCEGIPPKSPQRAAMLRLRFELPEATSATLVGAALHPASPLTLERLDQVELPILPTPTQAHEFGRALARLAQNPSPGSWQVLQLPLEGRVEQILVARDRAYAAMPAAILVANGSFDRVAAAAKAWQAPPQRLRTAWAPWLLLTGYGLLLLVLRLKPPLGLRLRSALELVAIAALPLWLVVCGRIGDNLETVQLAAIAITVVFALSLLVGGAPAQPTSRTLKRGWWVALGSVLLTMALIVFVAEARLPEKMPELERIGHYLAWAALQQFLICVLAAERIERLAGSQRFGLVGSALLFGLLHTPNAMLMQLTFVAGLIWVWNWQRHRALLANIAAHAACGLLLTLSLPAHWLHSAEVSARYFLGSP